MLRTMVFIDVVLNSPHTTWEAVCIVTVSGAGASVAFSTAHNQSRTRGRVQLGHKVGEIGHLCQAKPRRTNNMKPRNTMVRLKIMKKMISLLYNIPWPWTMQPLRCCT